MFDNSCKGQAAGFGALIGHKEFAEFRRHFTAQISRAQQFMRDDSDDVSTVSLRDCARCVRLFWWHLAHQQPDQFKEPSARLRHASVLALAVCYWFDHFPAQPLCSLLVLERYRLVSTETRADFATVTAGYVSATNFNRIVK